MAGLCAPLGAAVKVRIFQLRARENHVRDNASVELAAFREIRFALALLYYPVDCEVVS